MAVVGGRSVSAASASVSQSILSYLWSWKRCNFPYFTKLVGWSNSMEGGEENMHGRTSTTPARESAEQADFGKGVREGGSRLIQHSMDPRLLSPFLLPFLPCFTSSQRRRIGLSWPDSHSGRIVSVSEKGKGDRDTPGRGHF